MAYIPNAPQTNTGPQTQGAGADRYGPPMCLIIHQLSPSMALLHLFQPPHGEGPCKEGVQHTRPWGRGQAVTVPAWCHLRGSKAGEEPPCTRCMEDIPACLPKASEWDKEHVRATGCLLGGQGAACRLWYQAGGTRGRWPECRPHLQ